MRRAAHQVARHDTQDFLEVVPESCSIRVMSCIWVSEEQVKHLVSLFVIGVLALYVFWTSDNPDESVGDVRNSMRRLSKYGSLIIAVGAFASLIVAIAATLNAH